jgi:hypothetical protein
VPAKYAAWTGNFTNFTEIGPSANPDGDRMSNIMEFAFGTDPTVQDSSSLAIDGSVHGSPIPVNLGSGAFEFYFIRRKDHDTLGSFSYTPQFSNDLKSFTDSVATPDWVIDSSLDANNYEVVKVPYPAGTRFGRIEINITP